MGDSGRLLDDLLVAVHGSHNFCRRSYCFHFDAADRMSAFAEG